MIILPFPSLIDSYHFTVEEILISLPLKTESINDFMYYYFLSKSNKFVLYRGDIYICNKLNRWPKADLNLSQLLNLLK